MKGLDDWITGKNDPNAPFNQVDWIDQHNLIVEVGMVDHQHSQSVLNLQTDGKYILNMEKRMVNITFQVHDEQSNDWESAPIVYVLENVPVDKDISELQHCISTIKGNVTVRTARLFLDDPITSKQACKYNGGYYQANWNNIKWNRLP